MLGTEVSVALTLALLPVVVWCTTCALRRPAHGGHEVPKDAEVWHAVMGLVMLLTLWTTASGDWGWAGAGLFVAATTWCVMRAWGHPAPGRYRRLGVMSVAMVAMLVPTAAGAATPHHTSMAMAGRGADGPWLSGLLAWVVALVLALVALSALLAADRTAPRRARVFAGCEVVMAATMVVAALAMV
ncbi:MAG: DUF5134 domain-containing protein [Nocardioides sp.]